MKTILREMVCQKCDHAWKAPFVSEYGIENLKRDADEYCKRCGCEGIPGDVISERTTQEERKYQDFKDCRELRKTG
jgi:hypothetical protein